MNRPSRCPGISATATRLPNALSMLLATASQEWRGFQVAARAFMGESPPSWALQRGWSERRRYDASVPGLSIPWLIKADVTSHDDTLKCCAASSMKSSSGTLDPK